MEATFAEKVVMNLIDNNSPVGLKTARNSKYKHIRDAIEKTLDENPLDETDFTLEDAWQMLSDAYKGATWAELFTAVREKVTIEE